MEKKIFKSLNSLEAWFENNNFRGFDPYDVKAHPFVLRIAKKGTQSKIMAIFREIVYEIFILFPKASRKLLNIKPKINNKALGLIAMGYQNLYLIKDDNSYLEKSADLIELLLKRNALDNKGLGWGYPFNWQSTEFIPANTPNGIVTTTVGEALWQQYRLTKKKYYLEKCEQVCEFLLSLPRHEINNNQLCFAYTPLFQNHVHNLNLFIAEVLLKVGRETGNEMYIQTAQKAINYTLANQREDGSFDYNGPPEKPQNLIDNYHTGYVLRMLFSIWKLTNEGTIYQALKKGYSFYINNFFLNKEIPKFKPEKKYRIDIHSCSESIITTSLLHAEFSEGKEISLKVLDWTLRNLQNEKGEFIHGIFKSKLLFLPVKSKITYIRWSQAWMFYALSSLLCNLNVR